MTECYQVALEGNGFHVPLEGDKPAKGFITFRRVRAATPEEAGRKAVEALEGEEKYRWLIVTTERELGRGGSCSLRVSEVVHLSWFQRHFSKYSKAFIFYQDETT